MVISEIIEKLQALQAEHGDIEVLEGHNLYEVYGVHLLEVENDDDYPKDYNMPKGTKVCTLHYG